MHNNKTVSLKRSVSLTQLTLFGTGTILGAGIYVLIGKVAGEAGFYAPWAFLLAAIIAGFSAFSYAEMSARYPRSAGEAAYVQAAFGRPWLSSFIGWAIIINGLISAATLSSGFVGYFQVFVPWPKVVVVMLPIISLGLLAAWGIGASMKVAVVVTFLEILGLLFIMVIAGDSLLTLPAHWQILMPDLTTSSWISITTGCFLAFYAFIGFEDIVNIAEEVVEPSKNMPIAIILSISIATLFYLIISLIAVLSLPLSDLASSDKPFALLMETRGYSPLLISSISMIAIINGALVQIIMASRVLYGMADQGLAPSWLSRIHSGTQTPVIATFLVTASIIILAISLPIVTLAKSTSFIILSLFALVNLSLLIIKQREPDPLNIKTYPVYIPIIGLFLCIGLLVIQML